jgi:hypothetical protein
MQRLDKFHMAQQYEITLPLTLSNKANHYK